jgi:LysR family transcriptional regulator, hydrogen peroxide-inducible genes activator
MKAAAQDVSIRQLQYVVAVAEELGFHRAADRLHVSQPTLSAQVQLVERVLGVVIFERDRRRVLVTKPGEAIVARARSVLLAVEELIRAAEQTKDAFAATLRIGVIPTIAPYLLPEITPAIRAKYPKLELVFREEKTDDVMRELREGKIDAGLVALIPELGDVDVAEIADDPFVVALPTGHSLGKKKSIHLFELASEPVLLLEEGHCLRGQALELCSKVGAREADLRATSLATLVQMVSAGAGVTLLPKLAVDVENRRGQLDIRPLAGTPPSRSIVLVWRRGSPMESVFRAVASTSKRAASARRVR